MRAVQQIGSGDAFATESLDILLDAYEEISNRRAKSVILAMSSSLSQERQDAKCTNMVLF